MRTFHEFFIDKYADARQGFAINAVLVRPDGNFAVQTSSSLPEHENSLILFKQLVSHTDLYQWED
jgi:hypothetical protein